MSSQRRTTGFSLVEIMVVIGIISILSGVILPLIPKAKEKAYFAKSEAEFKSINTALEIYRDEYNSYPGDVSRSLPPGIEEFLGPGEWPEAPWPESVYDWEAWDIDGNGFIDTYQISIRFCPLNDEDNCKFPNEEWAENFDYYSSVFYCITGDCRSHNSQPIDHPGYCINCQCKETELCN